LIAVEVAGGLRVVRLVEDGIAVGGKRVEEGKERRWRKGE
jgi:hypothetical protein